jgi:hypothetical protein
MASGQTLVWSHVSVWMGYLISVCKCACLPLSYMNVSEHALNVSSASDTISESCLPKALAWPPTSWTLALQLNSSHTVNTMMSPSVLAIGIRVLIVEDHSVDKQIITGLFWTKGQIKTYAMKLRPLKMNRGGAWLQVPDPRLCAQSWLSSNPANMQITVEADLPGSHRTTPINDFFSVFVAKRQQQWYSLTSWPELIVVIRGEYIPPGTHAVNLLQSRAARTPASTRHHLEL